MVRITGISQAGSFGSGGSLFTRRDQIDNSEMYINSKLSALYQRAIADCFVSTKLNSIKKFTDGNKIDKMV